MSVTRYDMDFDDDVLYCYEIQLEESCRGKGLGKFMMKVLRQREKEKLYHIYLKVIDIFLHQVLELLTIQAGLLKTMLTVFKHNTKAVTFFKEVQIKSNKPPQRSVANDRIQLQGLKYSLDETTPVDTIQVKQNTKKSLILGQNKLFGFYFMTLVIIELFQKSFFHRSSLTTRS